ncbi:MULTISPECIES: phage antirepressor N-terminal domain-containing protein [unclassified Providencia]|uniref:phage antirepressor N-terminal domain-containing protein n=1 Tax=unclassified Providencia TaxID=2633465 RepID=UPI00234AC8BF|nr:MULTISPECIES: phage antirepressor N-terminal domain-containing protein [unclassified Providencia]WOB87390.1 phage antirepressor N-terminal domain-containing protein [Providencia sp. PROV040]
MNSIAIIEPVSTSNIQFHGQQIITAMAEGVAYVAMKPIVENLGMSWSTQLRKINENNDKFNCVHMNMVAADKKLRDVLCMPLKKLNGWLFSINPSKVKESIRSKLVAYQEECFLVLHEYWTTGEVKAKHKSTVQERNPLKNAVNLLVSKKGIMYPEAYSLVHQQFNVSGIDELTADQIPMAVEYVHKLVMEGEYLPKQDALPVPKLEIDYPLTWYPDNFPFVDMCFYKNGQLKVTQSMLTETKSPSKEILSKLESAGYDVTAAKAEIESLRHTMIEMSWALGQIASFAKMKDVVNKTFTA